MDNITKKEEMLKNIDENISKIKDKNFNIYFFVLDSKGNPTSMLEYIYQMAYTLKGMGYNVSMLHQEKEFIGVGEWLGEEYASLPHYNIETENVEVSACDFLFIPEIYTTVMTQTKKLPCKRVVIVQNFDNFCELMPINQSMGSLGIHEGIVMTKEQEKKMNKYFPNVRCHIVPPSIKKVFREDKNNPQKLIINIVSRQQDNINKIIKPFYWKNEIYKWVSFRDLRGLPQETFANALREAAITIWVDDTTTFGHTLLEALKCGTLVLAKQPNNPSEWMLENEDLSENILWFDQLDDLSDILPNIIRSWTSDMIPQNIIENQRKFDDLYTEEEQKKAIEDVFVNTLFENRIKAFEEIKSELKNKDNKKEEE